MPHAIALDRKYRAAGLKVVLVHTQQRIDLESFMWTRFATNRAMVTGDNPIAIGDAAGLALPRAALVGIDGKVLAIGHRNEVGKLIDELIPRELARMKEGYGADRVVARARAAFLVDLDFAATDRLLEDHRPDDEAAAADAIEARVELQRHLDRVIDEIRGLLDAGRPTEALARFEKLEKGVKGRDGWLARIDFLRQRLAAEADQKTLALEGKLESALAKAAKGGVRKGMAASLRKLAAPVPETPLGRRITRLATVWERLPDR